MRKQMKSAALSLVLTMLLCAFFGGTVQASDPVSPSVAGTLQETAAVSETSAEKAGGEAGEVKVALPADNGLAGIYKWVELEDEGILAYLILWDDGTGSMDMVGTGTVRGVFLR